MGRSLTHGEDVRPGHLRIVAQVLCIGLMAAAAWFFVHHLVYQPWHRFFDLRVYSGAVAWWVDGKPLYSYQLPNTRYGFTYPPFAALLMTPLAVLGAGVARVLVTAACALVVVAITWWLLAPVARRAGWTPWFAVGLALPVVFLLEPIRDTMGFGQVNLFIGALVFIDVIALRRGHRWAGVAIGLAAAVKLTPAIFVLYLVLTRRWRPAAVAVGTFLAATACAFVLATGTSLQFWTSTLWQTSRVGSLDNPNNQSVMGVLARAMFPAVPGQLVWALLAGGVLALGMRRAVRAFRAGDELVGMTVTGLVGALVSPISWGHHLVWIVPAIVVLVDVATGTRRDAGTPPFLRTPGRPSPLAAGVGAVAMIALFSSSLPWAFKVPGPGAPPRDDLLGILGQDTYVMALLALVALLPIRARVVAEPVVVAVRPSEPALAAD